MKRSMADVIATLTAEGLVPSGADAAARETLRRELANDIPWYLRIAVGFGAWLSVVFLLFSLFGMAGLRDEYARGAVGAIMIVGAAWLKRDERGEFLRWAAVALALAGGALVASLFAEMTDDATITSLVCIVIALALIWWFEDFVLRFLASLAAGVALMVIVFDTKNVSPGFDVALLLFVACAAYVWRARLARRNDRSAEMLVPVGYALVLLVCGVLMVRLSFTGTFGGRGPGNLLADGLSDAAFGPLAGIGLTVALVALVWKILDEHDTPLSDPKAIAVLIGAVALGFGAIDSPGLIAGVVALVLAFDRRNPVLLGMATIFMIGFLSLYYYDLDLTLLQKSGVLVGSGALLFGIRSQLARAA